MSQSEKHKFEAEWQRAFESAAETPPPSVWNGIEERLDARQTTVVPLAWWRSPKVLYAAAAVAALLLLSWPVLRLSQEDSTQKLALESPQPNAEVAIAPEPVSQVPEVVARIQQPSAAAPATPKAAMPETERLADMPSAFASEVPSVSASEVPDRSERIASEQQSPRPTATGTSGLAALPQVSMPEAMTMDKVADKLRATDLMPKAGRRNNVAGKGFMPKFGGAPAQTPTIIAITSSNRHGKPEDLERVIMGSSTVPLRTPALTSPIARRSPVGTSERAVHLGKRAIRYDETEMPPLHKRGRMRELWAGLSLMPSLFNPRIDVTSAPVAFSNAKASRESLAGASRGQLSYAVQLQGGRRLSRRWSVETGISYLKGNSDFKSPGYILDATTSRSQNVLENALTTSNRQSGLYFDTQAGINGFNSQNGAYIALDQNTDNDYRYVQVPAQAGYTLNPDGRLSYTLLGGVVANLFLQNQIQNGQGATLKTTADDGVYRGLSWSATTGVRMNYRLAEHWDATLTGSYQKALASVLRDSRTLDSRPQLYGVAWGVRYVF